jgi:O-antigen ligase
LQRAPVSNRGTIAEVQHVKTVPSRVAVIIWAVLLAASCAALYTFSTNAEPACIVVSLFGVVFLSSRKMPARAIDWNLLVIAVFGVLSLVVSPYAANGIASTRAVVLSFVVFLAVRLTIRGPLPIVCFASVLGIGGAALALKGLGQFMAEAGRLSEAGFSNLLAFRSRLIVPPTPWIPGEWFTLVLLGLPFACALPAYLWRKGRTWLAVAALLPPLAITATVTLSLSRAVFWSTVLFFFASAALMVASKVVSPGKGVALLAGTLGGLALVLACESAIYPGLLKTYAGQHASQTRSTQGRVGIWHRSMELVRAHPLVGVGASNAALMLLSSADDEETTGFASRTFSLPVQIVVEKGIIGLLLYGAFLVLLAREFLKTMRYSPPLADNVKAQASGRLSLKDTRNTTGTDAEHDAAYKGMVCCFAAGIIAVLLRELTYSSLMEHSLTLVLVAALAALICRPELADGKA